MFLSHSTSCRPLTLRTTTTSTTTKTPCESNTGLVLEVVHERKIILAKKAEHKLSQLWIMTSNGHLVPFTPLAPRTSRRSTISSNSSTPKLVLDIEVVPDTTDNNKFIRKLVLKSEDKSRSDTQSWFFEGNTLKCCLNSFAVCGANGLQANTLAVLGQYTSDTFNNELYGITRQKLRPGSGVLSVRMYAVGPTQVVEVSDSQHDTEKEELVDGLNNSTADFERKKTHSTEVVFNIFFGVCSLIYLLKYFP